VSTNASAHQESTAHEYYPRAALASTVADTLQFQQLPDFEVYAAIRDTSQATIEAAAAQALADGV